MKQIQIELIKFITNKAVSMLLDDVYFTIDNEFNGNKIFNICYYNNTPIEGFQNYYFYFKDGKIIAEHKTKLKSVTNKVKRDVNFISSVLKFSIGEINVYDLLSYKVVYCKNSNEIKKAKILLDKIGIHNESILKSEYSPIFYTVDNKISAIRIYGSHNYDNLSDYLTFKQLEEIIKANIKINDNLLYSDNYITTPSNELQEYLKEKTNDKYFSIIASAIRDYLTLSYFEVDNISKIKYDILFKLLNTLGYKIDIKDNISKTLICYFSNNTINCCQPFNTYPYSSNIFYEKINYNDLYNLLSLAFGFSTLYDVLSNTIVLFRTKEEKNNVIEQLQKENIFIIEKNSQKLSLTQEKNNIIIKNKFYKGQLNYINIYLFNAFIRINKLLKNSPNVYYK